MTTIAEAFITMRPDFKGFKEETESGVGATLDGLSSKFTSVGTSLTIGLTATLLAVSGLAAKAAIDFESAFAGVRKTVDATEPEFEALRQGIIDMSREVPASANAIAAVAEAAGQLGISTPNILNFTRTMIDLGESTNLSATEAATALARFINITGLGEDQISNLGSAIVALGNNMATTEAEIVEMGLRIAGAGRQVGLTEPQIMAFAAALSSVGVEAQAGGSAISRTFIQIAQAVNEGSDDLAAFAEVAGMSSQEFARAFEEDASRAMLAFVGGLAEIEKSGGDVLGTLDALGISEIRQRDAVLRLTGGYDVLAQALGIAEEAFAANTALSTEAEERYKTMASQLAMFRNRITETAIELGGALAPAMISALDASDPLIAVIEKAVAIFVALPQPVQTAVIAFGAFLVALGPVAFIVGQLISTFGALTTAIGAARVAAIASTGAFSAMIPILGGLGIAIGAAIVAQKLFGDSSADLARQVAAVADKESELANINRELADATGIRAKLLGDIKSELEKQIGAEQEHERAMRASEEAARAQAEATANTLRALGDFGQSVKDVTSDLGDMTIAAKDAFGALGEFKNVPTLEQLQLQSAIADVNYELAINERKLRESIAAGDGNEQAIRDTIAALKDELTVLEEDARLQDLARDAAIKAGQAKVGASGNVQDLVQSEKDLIAILDEAVEQMASQEGKGDDLRQTFVELAPAVGNSMGEVASAIWAGVQTSNEAIGSTDQQAHALLDTFIALAPEVGNSMGEVASAIWASEPQVGAAASAVGASATNGLGRIQEAAPLADNAITSFIAYIWAGVERVAAAAAAVAQTAVNTMRAMLGIASPSKVAQQIGRDVIDGLVAGIEAGTHTVAQLATHLGFAITDNLAGAINTGSSSVQSSIMSILDMIKKWGADVVGQMTETFKQAVGIAQRIAAESAKGAAAQPVLGSTAAATVAKPVSAAVANLPNPHAASPASSVPGLTQSQVDFIDYMNRVQGMADGGLVRARSGGSLVRLGEGGEDEYVIPASKMRGGLGVTVYGNVQYVLPNVRNTDDAWLGVDWAIA